VLSLGILIFSYIFLLDLTRQVDSHSDWTLSLRSIEWLSWARFVVVGSEWGRVRKTLVGPRNEHTTCK